MPLVNAVKLIDRVAHSGINFNLYLLSFDQTIDSDFWGVSLELSVPWAMFLFPECAFNCVFKQQMICEL